MLYFVQLLLFLFAIVLLSSGISNALVVGPLLTVSILKLTVYFVSVISGPIIAFFQILKKENRLKGLVLAVLIIAVISGVVYFGLTSLTNLKRTKLSRDISPKSSMQGISYEENKMIHDYYDTGSLSAAPELSNQQLLMKVSINDVLKRAIITGFLFSLLLFIPLGLIFWLVNRRKIIMNLVEVILVSELISFTIAFSGAFFLLIMSYKY